MKIKQEKQEEIAKYMNKIMEICADEKIQCAITVNLEKNEGEYCLTHSVYGDDISDLTILMSSMLVGFCTQRNIDLDNALTMFVYAVEKYSSKIKKGIKK